MSDCFILSNGYAIIMLMYFGEIFVQLKKKYHKLKEKQKKNKQKTAKDE